VEIFGKNSNPKPIRVSNSTFGYRMSVRFQPLIKASASAIHCRNASSFYLVSINPA
jgi:hypothetical protein